MNITRQIVSDRLLAYLNHAITLDELVDWAENTFIDDALTPDADVDLLNDILQCLAAADSAQFPLTWEVCADFMERLGTPVRVFPVVA
jgi:hypothetical protein